MKIIVININFKPQKTIIMKNGFFYSLLLMLSFSLMSSSCSSDDNDENPNDNSTEIAQIENSAAVGTWIILSYVDSGQDETNDFAGYNFTFAADGILTATNGTSTHTGSWSVTDSNSTDDSSTDIDFNISFVVPTTSNFDDLIDDWEIVSHSDTTISLIDISGGNGGTDTLVFQKN
jgi:hypothetical protein